VFFRKLPENLTVGLSAASDSLKERDRRRFQRQNITPGCTQKLPLIHEPQPYLPKQKRFDWAIFDGRHDTSTSP
jgi:hypothetical protein